jgi:SAM-dependent methyltransferase
VFLGNNDSVCPPVFTYKRLKILAGQGVLPLYARGGQLYLMDHLSSGTEDLVLDLGTGCGNLSLVAAMQGAQVVSLEKDPVSLAVAMRNADLNGLGSKIRFIRGDLFSGAKPKKFDFIVTNPPFVPMPIGCKKVIHSYGGRDGLHYLRRILAAAPKHIKRVGHLQMLALSIGYHDQPRLLRYVERFSLARNARVNLVRLYDRPLPLKDFVRAYRGVTGWSCWQDYLLSLGTHLHYFVVDATCDQSPRISWAEVKPTERRRYWLNWEHWKERFVWKPE